MPSKKFSPPAPALTVVVVAAVVAAAAGLIAFRRPATTTTPARAARPDFVAARGARFVVNDRPFRFVGANVAVMYGPEERSATAETLRQVAGDGVRVVRVWAFGDDGEASLAHLDRVLVEAAKHNLRVQICLTNWWRDTQGVTRYLRQAGIADAEDDTQPYGINVERAMQFYSDERTRGLYREHVRSIVARRNALTGNLYRDDPTVFAYELVNEAPAAAGRYDERRRWVAEMSAFIKSLDPDHMVTPGTWGYRSSWERRAWLAEHQLPTVDFCDVHHYPRDDTDSFVDSEKSLGEFIDNRAAAAFSLNKPLVFGEFGMSVGGFKNLSAAEWFRAFFAQSARAGAAGAMYWIFTPDVKRDYGISYLTERDRAVRAECASAAARFAKEADAAPAPASLLDAGRHLVPRQFVFDQAETAVAAGEGADGSAVYRFAPENAIRGRFERIGGGAGYAWGSGVGFFEYAVPARAGWRRVHEIVVRARAQPVPPWDANNRITKSDVTLFVNGRNCGTKRVSMAGQAGELTEEWRVDALALRLAAARGQKLFVRFEVRPDAGEPYGLNLTKYADHDIAQRAPIEVEIR